MELPVLAVFLVSCILTVGSHPKNSDIIPKEYYRRQILQPLPGYIPVYIKADPEPIIRSKTKTNVHHPKVTESKEKQLFKQSDEILSKSKEATQEQVKSEEPVKEVKIPLVKLPEKLDSVAGQTKTQKKEESS